MKIKNICYRDVIIKQIKKGLQDTTNILSLTLGPRGKNIVLWDKTSKPQIINDGTSIINKINNQNFVEHIGQFLVKDVIFNVNDSVGDGTSTTGILTGNVLSRGLSLIHSGYTPYFFSNGIFKCTNILLNKLYKISWPLNNNKDILNIATNSSGGDKLLGKLIVNAYKRVGTDGLISIETSDKNDTSLIVYGGLQIDRGYVSHKFINNFKNSTCEYNDSAILVTDLPIDSIKQAAAIMQSILQIDKPLLIISDTISKKCLNAFLVNNKEKNIKICAVKIPSFGSYRKSILQDISIATGASFYSSDSGMKLKNLKPEDFGSLRKCIVSENNCTLISKNRFKNQIKSRIDYLEKLLSSTDSTFETNLLSERIAKLSGGIAVIRVGAPTELELIDKKLRLEDAKNATFSAVTQGVVTGSAVSLVHLSNFLTYFMALSSCMEESLGMQLLRKSIVVPNRNIILNSDEDGYLMEKKIVNYPFEIGYDAEYKCLTNLVGEGVVDPSLLLYNSLISLCKISSVLMHTQAVISKRHYKKISKISKVTGTISSANFLNM
mmetsp:Transcript_37017/g.59421  ORF Transcript_37017/g.59421 Transcript_37017/m.59421 type:complete len:550 (-) Transcript_37017:2893-4542(-)